MNIRSLAAKNLQPSEFEFTEENLKLAQKIVKKYPEGRQASAVISLLFLVQKQHHNWLPIIAMEYVANFLQMPHIRVLEVATFYSMFNLSPVGKYHIQVCGTTPCWLRGSDNIKEVCQTKLGLSLNHTTSDKIFSLTEVECLGGCANSPVVQINDDYYEDLNTENFSQLLDDLQNDHPVKTGSQSGRQCSKP